MKKFDLASSMEQVLNSDEYKATFSSSEIMKKLAFKRVADENKETEVESEFSKVAEDKCSNCKGEIPKDKPGPCVCQGDCKDTAGTRVSTCHSKPAALYFAKPPSNDKYHPFTGKAEMSAEDAIVIVASDRLITVSEELDNAGFDELSAKAILLANEIIAEAAKKKMKKNKKSSDKKSSKKSSDKKSSKKSSKKS